MNTKPVREGFHTVTPYLIIPKLDDFVAFVEAAFDAEETYRTTGAAGGTHVEVRIGDSMIMVGAGAASDPMPTMLHLYVHDVDPVYQRALQAGATSLMEPSQQPDGDRRAGVQDAFGNQWYITTPAPQA